MNQTNITTYQSNLVFFDEVKSALHSVCNEGHSGVFFISSASGDSAGFSLRNGKIVDIAYKSIRGTKALFHINNIERARFFFDQNQLTLPDFSKTSDTSPDTNQVFSFLNIACDEKEHVANNEQAKNYRIMIIDDSLLVRAVVTKILADNYDVIEVIDGESALLAIEQEHPDLVLLDMVMPGIDGNEVLRRIRASHTGELLPVIILTANDSLVDDGLGENGRFPKCLDLNGLLSMVDKFFH